MERLRRENERLIYKVGELSIDNDFLKKLEEVEPAVRRKMVKKHCALSRSRQCRLLYVGRTSVYYRPKQSGRTLDLMKRLDALYTEDPTYGARRMCAALRNAGVTIGRYKVRRLMEKMGLEAIYRKSKLSAPHPGHTVYPYLLRGVKSTR